MGINPADFRQMIVRPTLIKLDQWSPSLENLLIGTAAQASGLGMQLQSENGFGIYQMDARQHQMVWDCFLAFDADLASKVRGLASQREFLAQPHWELATNLSYATAIAWGLYAHRKAVIPADADNLDALARCWHQYFCPEGSQGTRHFISQYQQLVLTEKAVAA